MKRFLATLLCLTMVLGTALPAADTAHAWSSGVVDNANESFAIDGWDVQLSVVNITDLEGNVLSEQLASAQNAENPKDISISSEKPVRITLQYVLTLGDVDESYGLKLKDLTPFYGVTVSFKTNGNPYSNLGYTYASGSTNLLFTEASFTRSGSDENLLGQNDYVQRADDISEFRKLASLDMLRWALLNPGEPYDVSHLGSTYLNWTFSPLYRMREAPYIIFYGPSGEEALKSKDRLTVTAEYEVYDAPAYSLGLYPYFGIKNRELSSSWEPYKLGSKRKGNVSLLYKYYYGKVTANSNSNSSNSHYRTFVLPEDIPAFYENYEWENEYDEESGFWQMVEKKLIYLFPDEDFAQAFINYGGGYWHDIDVYGDVWLRYESNSGVITAPVPFCTYFRYEYDENNELKPVYADAKLYFSEEDAIYDTNEVNIPLWGTEAYKGYYDTKDIVVHFDDDETNGSSVWNRDRQDICEWGYNISVAPDENTPTLGGSISYESDMSNPKVGDEIRVDLSGLDFNGAEPENIFVRLVRLRKSKNDDSVIKSAWGEKKISVNDTPEYRYTIPKIFDGASFYVEAFTDANLPIPAAVKEDPVGICTATSGVVTDPELDRDTGKTVEGDSAADKLVLATDSFSFENSEEDFGSEYTYKLSGDYYEAMMRRLTFGWRAYLRAEMNRNWGGSCYGMAAVASLVKAGRLDPGYFQEEAENTAALAAPKDSGVVRSLINYYQLMQLTPRTIYNTKTFWYQHEALAKLISELRSSDENEPVLVGLYKLDRYKRVVAGHAVVAYGLETDENANKYKIHIYDPNHKKEENTLTLSADLKEVSWGKYYTAADTKLVMSLPVDSENGAAYDWQNLEKELKEYGNTDSAPFVLNTLSLLDMDTLSESEQIFTLGTNYDNFTITDGENTDKVENGKINGRTAAAGNIIENLSYVNDENSDIRIKFAIPAVSAESCYTITPTPGATMKSDGATAITDFETSIFYADESDSDAGFYTSVSAKGTGVLKFYGDGKIETEFEEATEQTLTTAADDAETEWYELSVATTSTGVSVAQGEEAANITTKDAVELSITAQNDDASASLSVSSEAGSEVSVTDGELEDTIKVVSGEEIKTASLEENNEGAIYTAKIAEATESEEGYVVSAEIENKYSGAVEFNLLCAVYDKDGAFKACGTAVKTVAANGKESVSVDVACKKAAGDKVKLFLCDEAFKPFTKPAQSGV